MWANLLHFTSPMKPTWYGEFHSRPSAPPADGITTMGRETPFSVQEQLQGLGHGGHGQVAYDL